MKYMNQFVIAATALMTFTVSQSARAAEPLLSPRAQSIQIRVVPGSSVGDPDLIKNRPLGSAKAWDVAQSQLKVPSTGRDIDLAHAPHPSLPAKDPRFDSALRENALRQLQVAPLK